jgi:hypothetical protein
VSGGALDVREAGGETISEKQVNTRVAKRRLARRALLLLLLATAVVSGLACGEDDPQAMPNEAGRSAPQEDGAAAGEKAGKSPEGRKASGGEKRHSTDSRGAGPEGEVGPPARSQRFKPSELKGIRDAFGDIPEKDQRALERQVNPSKEQCRHAPFIPGCPAPD